MCQFRYPDSREEKICKETEIPQRILIMPPKKKINNRCTTPFFLKSIFHFFFTLFYVIEEYKKSVALRSGDIFKRKVDACLHS